jgi:MerR family transcriptional regulator, light-induced transcriptional regulator
MSPRKSSAILETGRFGEGQAMSNELQSVQVFHEDRGLERIKTLTQPLAPVIAKPTETHLQEFASVIENIIVPRLLMSHVNGNTALIKEKVSLKNVAVSDFIALTTKDDPSSAIDYVRHLMAKGVTFQDILLDLMAPAARVLGERWEEDKASFVEVALGVARMHRILREFDGVPSHLWSNAGFGRHALLLPAPGELHSFGLRLVQEFLLRESWTVTNKPVEHVNQLGQLVAQEHFDIVGLSLSGHTVVAPFLDAIRIIREKSKNRHVKIIVGGHLFVERPDLIESCGSDAYALDAPATVTIVNGWANQLSAVDVKGIQ